MKYYIKTFGCQMNASDSERIASFLESNSFKPLMKSGKADLSAEALAKTDLVVFNTCGIRQAAENRAYSFIHTLRKNNKKVKIILTGCIAHRKDVQKLLKDKVDLFFSINNFKKFEEFITCHPEFISGSQEMLKQVQDDMFNDINYLSIIPKHTNNFQANVPIMTGCNNFCSYCVVPYARGREVSRPAIEIKKEIRALVKKGYKHITLLGQNVNSYKSPATLSSSPLGRGCRVLATGEGMHNSKTINFSKLLIMINRIPGKFWISFVSSHPKDFSDELIEAVARCKKVCEWVHLPIQAGNDKILEKMNRRYTQAHYLGLIKKIRSTFKKYKPDMLYSLTSDIIVGFPGETKKQFMDSAKIMEKSRFDMVYFGQFSPRPGTAAWKMKDNVSKKEKSRREKFLNEILKKTAGKNNKKYIGKIAEVLVETCHSRMTGEKEASIEASKKTYFGKTRTMKNVKVISSKKNLVGKIIKVKITKANIWSLSGYARSGTAREPGRNNIKLT